MNEPDISPLAKRLAEENNVNWRNIQGSGPDNKVVERDILEYLARVMAGEEDTNPTAEPVPEGMEAWPEEDVVAFAQEDTSDSTPEVSDIIEDIELMDDDSLTLDDDLAPAPEEAAVETASDIDEDIFLFDDDDDLLADDSVVAADTQVDQSEDEIFKTLANEDDSLLDLSVESETSDVSISAESNLEEELSVVAETVPPDLVPSTQETSEEVIGSFGDVLEATNEGIETTTAASFTTIPNTMPTLLQGIVLRRHLQMGALVDAMEKVAAETELTIDATVFIVKAAAKALQSYSLGDGSNLALVNLSQQLTSSHSIERILESNFKTLINDLSTTKADENAISNASLVVANLAKHELDEVMLSTNVPVLSLGRIVSEENFHLSTLSFSGSVLPEQADDFLARVAELLSEPIRLIV